jgi:hypothetical protein
MFLMRADPHASQIEPGIIDFDGIRPAAHPFLSLQNSHLHFPLLMHQVFCSTQTGKSAPDNYHFYHFIILYNSIFKTFYYLVTRNWERRYSAQKIWEVRIFFYYYLHFTSLDKLIIIYSQLFQLSIQNFYLLFISFLFL